MGSAIGTVSIDFDAGIGKFEANTEKVSKRLDDFGKNAKEAAEHAKSFDEASNNMFQVAGGELLAKGVEKVVDGIMEAENALAEMTEKTAKETAEMARFAETAGVSTQAVQGLRAAATGMGIDSNVMDKGMLKLSAAIGEAAMKTGPMRDQFEKLGLDVQKLADTPADQQLYAVADALKQINNVSQRMATAKEIFGEREFRELAPLIARGSEGLEEAAEHAQKLGLVLSQTDISRLQEINRTMKEQEEQIKGLTNQWAVGLGDVNSMWNKIKIELLGGTAEAAKGQAKFFTDELYPNALNALNVFGILDSKIDAMNAKRAKANEEAMAGHAEFDPSTEISTAIGYYTELEKKLKDVERAHTAALTTSGHGETDADREVEKLIAEYARAGKAIPAEITNIAAHIQELGQQEEIQKIAAELQKSIAGIGMTDAEKKVVELNAHFEEMSPAIQEATIAATHLAVQLDGMERHAKVQEKIKTLMTDVTAGFDEQARKMAELKSEGADDDQLKQYDQLLKAQVKQKEQQKELEEAKHLAEAGQAPAEKYNETILHLNELLRDGAINHKLFTDAKKQADADYFKAAEQQQQEADRHTGAMARRFDFFVPGNAGKLPELPKPPKIGANRGAGGDDEDDDEAAGGAGRAGAKGNRRSKGFQLDTVELPPLQLDEDDKRVQVDIRDAVKKLADNPVQTIGAF